jgi:O-acetyl-ADP-ribose deacetylase (regulator of RNase III)
MSIRFTTGNLLEAETEALVNTVNTVGVMGKGIALMFKEAFPDNFKAYQAACKAGQVRVGELFVSNHHSFLGPKWIINFPTKQHWRNPSQMSWIESGLVELRAFIEQNNVKSIALPPLGAGNGGLDWSLVKNKICDALLSLDDVDVVVFEPTEKYQNIAKKTGVQKLTIPRAMVAEIVRRYCNIGIECSVLEIQKLSYFLERLVVDLSLENNLSFEFSANRYGPYSSKLIHLLNGLDGSYLHSDKRLADSGPNDVINFDYGKAEVLKAFLSSDDAKPYREALDRTEALIDGLQSPFGLELLATVDWLVKMNNVQPEIGDIRRGLANWFDGGIAARRKSNLFDERVVEIALTRLKEFGFA